MKAGSCAAGSVSGRYRDKHDEAPDQSMKRRRSVTAPTLYMMIVGQDSLRQLS